MGTSPVQGIGGKVPIDYKDSVRVATAAALPAYTRVGNTITANANGSINTAGIDGVATLAVNDRVLLKNGAAGADNGIYVITALGAAGAKWSMERSPDANDTSKVTPDMGVFVEEGTANADFMFILTTNGPITLNTTALTFTKISAIPAGPCGGTDIGGTYPDALVVVADAITFAKMQNVNTARVLGRGAALAGDPQELTLSSTNGITFTYGDGTLAIATSQDLQTAASPSFAGLTLTGLTANLLLGVTAAGTSAAKVIGFGTGTAPSTSPADMVQMYSADIVAGNAAPFFRTENGTIIKLDQPIDTTASPTFADLTLTGTETFKNGTASSLAWRFNSRNVGAYLTGSGEMVLRDVTSAVDLVTFNQVVTGISSFPSTPSGPVLGTNGGPRVAVSALATVANGFQALNCYGGDGYTGQTTQNWGVLNSIAQANGVNQSIIAMHAQACTRSGNTGATLVGLRSRVASPSESVTTAICFRAETEFLNNTKTVSTLALYQSTDLTSVQTVTNFRVLDIANLGSATVTNGYLLRLDAALGTHVITTNADKTGSAKLGTVKIDVNGTLGHLQIYANA